MKKSLLSLAVLSAISVGAYADGVELYGVLDLAVASVAHQTGADSDGQGNISVTGEKIANSNSAIAGTWTGLVSGGISPSRWGIKGSETIDSDLSATFKAEQRFNPTSGVIVDQALALKNGYGTNGTYTGSGALNNIGNSSLNGQFFNAEAWVGLDSKEMGSLSFGRQYAQTAAVINKYDPVPAFQFSPAQYSGALGGGMGISELLRQDSSVVYKNTNGDISYGLMYKFGGIAGSTQAGSSYSANIIYTKDRFSIGVGYLGANDALFAKSGNSTGIGVTDYNTNGWNLGLSYKLNDDINLKAGISRWYLSAASNPSLVNNLVYNGSTSDGVALTRSVYYGSSTGQGVMFAGFDYAFTPKTKIMVGYYVRNDDAVSNPTTSSTASATATASGNINWVSVLLDYTITKRTDVYAGGMAENYGGSLYSTYVNNSIIGVGMRHKF